MHDSVIIQLDTCIQTPHDRHDANPPEVTPGGEYLKNRLFANPKTAGPTPPCIHPNP